MKLTGSITVDDIVALIVSRSESSVLYADILRSLIYVALASS